MNKTSPVEDESFINVVLSLSIFNKIVLTRKLTGYPHKI